VKPVVRLILLIVVVVLLYIGSLVYGVKFGESGDKPSADQSSREWLAWLSSATSRFAPPLDGSKLWCNRRRLSDEVTLTQADDSCEIVIEADPDSSRKMRHADLRVLPSPSTAQPTVYIRAKYPERQFPRAERDRTRCFVDPPPLQVDPAPLRAFRLEVRYTPREEDIDNPWECWLLAEPDKPVSLTVLKQGGKLTLRCVGCEAGVKREIHLTTGK
jgi:hypothetical protein